MGAAGATIERAVVRWMLEKVGFDREAGGWTASASLMVPAAPAAERPGGKLVTDMPG